MDNNPSPPRSRRKASNPIGKPEFWSPKKSQILKLKEKYTIPSSIKISALPAKANIYTGEGVPDDVLILSPHHLRYIRFPIHPVFQLMWAILGLHPFQLNPSSYLLLSAFLTMGWRWGVSLGLIDFFLYPQLCENWEIRPLFPFFTLSQQKSVRGKTNNYQG